MSWRCSEYRDHVRAHACVLCDIQARSEACHIGGIAPRGTGTKAPDYCCAPLCRYHHDRLDGRQLPPLGQRQRERTLKAALLCAGSFLELHVPSDEPDPDRIKGKISHRKKPNPAPVKGVCPICRYPVPGLHRPMCERGGFDE